MRSSPVIFACCMRLWVRSVFSPVVLRTGSAPETAKISLNTAMRNREIASQFSLSFFVLLTHVFSLLAHREFRYMPSTPRGSIRPSFPRDAPFSVTVWLSWIFARSQDSVLFRGLLEDFGGSSSWSMLNQLSCIFNVAFVSAWLFISLMVHPCTLLVELTGRWSCAITIQASTAVEIVFKWTARTVLPREPFLQSFPFSVSLKPETSRLYIS